MAGFETVEDYGKELDPLYRKQREDVAQMRASLLALSTDPNNPGLVKQALNNITVLRLYHQIARIIRYLEMMDKIEAKLYESIDCSLDNMNPNSSATWLLLVQLQEKLQKNLIESHKLLQPYIELQDRTFLDIVPVESDSTHPQILDANSRERLRTSAQAVLVELHSLQEVDNVS